MTPFETDASILTGTLLLIVVAFAVEAIEPWWKRRRARRRLRWLRRWSMQGGRR
jgi:hypothetical protein